MKKKRKERRKTMICSNCGQEMVCMNKFDAISQLIRGLYVWYVCPRRKEERGCGHCALLEVSPATESHPRIVNSVKFNKSCAKDKA